MSFHGVPFVISSTVLSRFFISIVLPVDPFGHIIARITPARHMSAQKKSADGAKTTFISG